MNRAIESMKAKFRLYGREWDESSNWNAKHGDIGRKFLCKSTGESSHDDLYAEDGLHFTKIHRFINKRVPRGPGSYRSEAFAESGTGQMITWGLQRTSKNGLPCIDRFDLQEVTQ